MRAAPGGKEGCPQVAKAGEGGGVGGKVGMVARVVKTTGGAVQIGGWGNMVGGWVTTGMVGRGGGIGMPVMMLGELPSGKLLKEARKPSRGMVEPRCPLAQKTALSELVLEVKLGKSAFWARTTVGHNSI